MTNFRKRQTISLPVYMIMHFAIDFSCFYYLFGTFSKYDYIGLTPAKGFILYNFLAFGMQAIIGAYYDGGKNRKRTYSSEGRIGTLLVMTGLIINTALPGLIKGNVLIEESRIGGIPYSVWLGIILVIVALGNAYFHIAGGVDSLVNSHGRMGRCGLFVSTGALGVSFGTYAGKHSILKEYHIVALLCIGFLALCYLGEVKEEVQEEAEQKKDKKVLNSVLPILCMSAIVLRAYVGAILTISFDTLFLAAFCTFLGKAIGGFLADRFSGNVAGTVAVAVSAICFYCFGYNDVMNAKGIVSFNIAMPITLYSLYLFYPKSPGFAFGLSTFALLIGSLASGLIMLSDGKQSIILNLTIVAAVCIFIATPGGTKRLTRQGEK